jgi:hypothetical protein
MCTTTRFVIASLLLTLAARGVHAAPVGPALTDCAPVCCPCDCDAAALEADDRVSREALAIGLALFVPAYIAGTAYGWSLPGAIHSVDSLPIIGAIAAGARDREPVDHAALLFSGGVQLIGALVTAVAAIELANVRARRWTVTVSAMPGSALMTAKVRW